MSNTLRKFKRQQERDQYRKFQRAWDDEQRFQRYLIENQGATVIDKDKQKVIMTSAGESVPVLGRKPTFRMWKVAAENRKAAQAERAASQDAKKMEVKDLSWDEGG